ncbi:unnamed protein product [[Actinomadura] parvosata subsp. kistnae]|nr:unnamed protein product [Actinomadura parvosata subsp. kistnae]
MPMREVRLSNGSSVTLYDTSGPYTDPAYEPDLRRACRAGARSGCGSGRARATRSRRWAAPGAGW